MKEKGEMKEKEERCGGRPGGASHAPPPDPPTGTYRSWASGEDDGELSGRSRRRPHKLSEQTRRARQHLATRQTPETYLALTRISTSAPFIPPDLLSPPPTPSSCSPVFLPWQDLQHLSPSLASASSSAPLPALQQSTQDILGNIWVPGQRSKLRRGGNGCPLHSERFIRGPEAERGTPAGCGTMFSLML
ncbi:hypothetical protein EYF80_003807 [Liparis tanakae]|uniref:Uncharacterized protein n=1 Tax=Liparis tanakae TaxID=230148 RepID=A0A4Z2J8H7_9TELE|nr:hypothetical protein EYF80_003807 [Liparis tanakae]